MTVSTDIRSWIYQEVATRVAAGMTVSDAADDVQGFVEDCAQLKQIWAEFGSWIVTNVYVSALRTERATYQRESATREPDTATATATASMATTERVDGVFGERRVDVSVGRRKRSIFYAEIGIGGRSVRYGAMTHEDWADRERFYKTAADNATSRHWAASKIKERVMPGKRTEECLTEAEFLRLLPPEGF